MLRAVQSVIFIRLSAIGDAVHALPALELARAALPDARIGWAVEAEAAPLLRAHPALDRVHVLDRRSLGHARGRPRALRQALAFGRDLRRERYDLAIDLQGLARSALVARIAARRVAGSASARELATLAYHDRLDVPRASEAHATSRSLALVRGALARHGVEVPAEAPPSRLVLADDARALASAALGGARAPIVLLPGAGKPANRPPVALLAAVARRLRGPFVVLGGAGDRASGAALARACGALDLTGRLDLAASAAVLERASVVLGGDTGPLHVARALGTPVVALFFAADPFRTGPAAWPGDGVAHVVRGGAACAPCLARTCRRPDRVRVCLDPLDPERIANVVARAARSRVALEVSA